MNGRTSGSTGTDLEAINAWARIGFAAEVCIRFVRVDDDACTAVARLGDRHRAPNGRIHGAALVALADTVCGSATILRLGGDTGGFATLDLHAQFLRSPRTPDVRCTARLLHEGRRTAVWDAAVHEVDTGRDLARVRCTQLKLGRYHGSSGRAGSGTPLYRLPRFLTLDVFTDRRYAGNPLAVLPAADGLSAERMQAITREIGYSETVFVTRRDPGAEVPSYDARIFTPGGEVPFAGHPMIGTAVALGHAGELPASADAFDLHLPGGTVRLRREGAADRDDGAPAWSFRPPGEAVSIEGIAPSEALLAAAGLGPHDAHAEWTSAGFSGGLPYTIQPVATRDALARARLDHTAWERGMAATAAPQLYLVCPLEAGRIAVRMFAPGHGVVEDPATGSAAVALGGYLRARGHTGGRWILEQGRELGRPGTIELRLLADTAGSAIEIAGRAVLVAEGTLHEPIPSPSYQLDGEAPGSDGTPPATPECPAGP